MATEAAVANVPPSVQTPAKNADTVMVDAKESPVAVLSTPAPVTTSQVAPTPQVATPQTLVPAINQQEYPAAVASNEAVISDERLFMDSFYKFHEALKSKPTIPKMGGKDLNVHLLYKEVTARGGLQQVIRDRKWKEITGAFEFPRTTTSASYVLRKYYVNLLHHFEQVYKNGAKGPLIPPPATLPGSSPSVQPGGDPALSEGGDQVTKKRPRKRKIQMPLIPQVDPAEAIGTSCKGSIEAKLDFGYLITMVVGGEKLKGVLYHVPTGVKVPSQFTNLPTLLASVNVDAAKTTVESTARRKRRRKEEMPKKDPNAPRPNRTGYNFFFAEQRQRLKALHPDKDRDISRMIGEAWNSLSEEQKTPYQERGVKDKERFKREMRDYREKMKSGHFDSAADLGTGQTVTSPEDPSVPDQPLEQDHGNAMGDDTPPTGEPTSETPHQQTSHEPSKGVPDQSLNQETPASVVSTQGEG
ncbi:protein MpARID-HMGBOX [Marchantia polymorpha subsp. ruderalis]|uniref:HMG box domain-containing protein n=2 Tax=Marchantia polymorpha TaxID=3197 RepID=A0AAF6AMI6_MARPO|nr:hypothetical protein MARPO_0043s0128 [Marchantia polymorpha]BBM97656.1 hypothetical protein Mp_1g07350 [Marchantia polymorpha subsp. ruderalis]PTQ39899.1 hypothetical protein MARPO_0043s0128 [Marchantia polymorpha]PTQ39900.1 hypothetical protein MARPO_0043s0128 [Marchantia polymorpha]PTQ39901.1 hypothetical protein MARPO_0043s0128 [Marchantia polymorpha]|eukprot:PTQ39898.1 hypothetical protein MARPO_0043s0128 [Marchantia polymorpha]